VYLLALHSNCRSALPPHPSPLARRNDERQHRAAAEALAGARASASALARALAAARDAAADAAAAALDDALALAHGETWCGGGGGGGGGGARGDRARRADARRRRAAFALRVAGGDEAKLSLAQLASLLMSSRAWCKASVQIADKRVRREGSVASARPHTRCIRPRDGHDQEEHRRRGKAGRRHMQEHQCPRRPGLPFVINK